jgi:hypothetical protein
MHRSKRVVNKRLSATSVVRLIGEIVPRAPDQAPNIILKPKKVKKRLPGAKLLIRLAKEREKGRGERHVAKNINMGEVEKAVDEIMADLAD